MNEDDFAALFHVKGRFSNPGKVRGNAFIYVAPAPLKGKNLKHLESREIRCLSGDFAGIFTASKID